MAVLDVRERIENSVLAWPGVTAAPHPAGGTEFRLERREIGHLHGDRLIDLPLPRKIRDDLIAGGWAEPHAACPDSGWASFYVRAEPDIHRALGLLEISYRLARQGRPAARGERNC
ncbi:MAG: DUF5519 family protein [Candidatus Tectomicrobia bacterium]|uniref:DUF5519 family protein n=1 Tax=Tectimicrobiota bacterium TaxID=2528274 RepID=A0A932MN54_UNCTE|nr:DUF5519 family protein [Candidatus Tectomicrobia bacterium]